MSDSNPSQSGPGSEPIEFGEWLAMTAESRGTSEEEILEQLISSYWTLNEMTEMIQQPETERPEDLFEHMVDANAVPPSRSEFERFATDVGERLAAVEEQLAELEADGSTSDTTIDELEERLETEFDTLRRILERLISSTSANEEDIDELNRRLSQDVGVLRAEQAQLDHLRRRAMDLGVRTASCDNCDRSVDLSLLPTPNCPTCGRGFLDIIPRNSFLGIGYGSNILETERDADGRRERSPPRAPPEAAYDASEPQGDRPAPRAGRGSRDFEWQGDRGPD